MSYNGAKRVYSGLAVMGRDTKSCLLDGVIWNNDIFQLPFLKSGTKQASWRLSPGRWDSHSVSARQSGPPGQPVREPFCQSGPSPVRMPAAWETAGGAGRRQARAELPFCLHALWSRGRKPREVTNVGLERFSFPVIALAGVADVLISGLRICLNYLYCA